jgi:hypothetical protein
LRAEANSVVGGATLPGVLQRKCACGGTPGPTGECETCKQKREARGGMIQRSATNSSPVNKVPEIVHDVLKSPGQPLERNTRAFMESRFGEDFSGVRVHTDSRAAESARAVNALAYTVGQNVVFGENQYVPTNIEGKHLLTHELTHSVQQKELSNLHPKSVLQNDNVENEAYGVADQVKNNRPVSAITKINNTMLQRQANTPHDRMIVEQARQRLPILRSFVNEWSGREARRLQINRERDPLLRRRQQMDERAGQSGSDLVEAMRPGSREGMERDNIQNLNQRPLNIEVNDGAVIFHVRFHVRFEDVTMRRRYNELVTTLQNGIHLVWDQRLSGTVFGQRQFRVEPTVALIENTAGRDQNFWLITVRPNNNSPMTYPGCSIPQNNTGVATSVTDPSCDGGIVSIPPSHVTHAGVLGHELLHLFGLVDRYFNMVHQLPTGNVNRNIPTRETAGRPDPLGAQDGRILTEDLTFLFDRFGVYTQEENRGLEILRRLENQGMSINSVIAEIHRLEEIIRLGYDPHSLVQPRRDFNDRILRDAENL